MAKMEYEAGYYVLMFGVPATAALRQVDDAEPSGFLGMLGSSPTN